MKNHKHLNLEEKEIYRLLNEIKLEESQFHDTDEEISSIQKERIKKNLKKRIKNKKNSKILKYSTTAAAIGLACLIGIGTISPTFAKNIPILNSITQILNDKIGDHGDYAEYSQVIDKSVIDNGISLTINEVLADDSRLIISYTIKSDKKVKGLNVFSLDDIKINGKNFSHHGSAMGHYIDDYTYIGSTEVDITWLNLPEKFNVDYHVSEIMDVKGKWNFAFRVSKDEISKKSIVFKPNKKIDFPDSIATVDKVVFSPIGTYISVSGDYKKQIPDSDSIFEYEYWIAYDDKGVELIPSGLGGGSSDKHGFQSEMYYQKVKEIPKYITILPCKITPSGGGGINLDDGTPIHVKTKKPKKISQKIDGTYPIELVQGNVGKLIIKEIKTETDATIVQLTVEGKAPYLQAGRLCIKDERDEELVIKDQPIKRNEQNPNEFTIKFEALDPNKNYSICTTDLSNIELREDLKFKIELNK